MHLVPDTSDAQQKGIEEKVRAFVADEMRMGEPGMAGMQDVARSGRGPRSTLRMRNGRGPSGNMEVGGMPTILEVRDDVECSADPGWDERPPAGVARKLEGR